MDEATYDSMRQQVGEQIAALKAEVAALSRDADLTPLMSSESLAALWEGAGTHGQRALLKAALQGVTLLPSKYRGDRTPIGERLVPVWRDSDGMPDDVAEGVQKTFDRRRRLRGAK
jgi:hypothetical protein